MDIKELRFATELGALETECGIKATDMTADELAALLDACRRLDHPFEITRAHLLDIPAKAGNMKLWPLSIGACVWYQYVLRNFGFSDEQKMWCMVYALAYGRNAGAFAEMYEKPLCEAAVLEMCKGITCTKEQLEEAIDAVLERENSTPEQPDDGQRQDADWEGLVARLEVESGIGRNEWLWGRSKESTIKAFREMTQLIKRKSGRGRGDDESKELDDAITNLAQVKAAIVRRLKGGAK